MINSLGFKPAGPCLSFRLKTHSSITNII